MNILVIDNFDSFTYNLVHYLEDLDCNIEVVRYDNFSLQIAKNYTNILKYAYKNKDNRKIIKKVSTRRRKPKTYIK